MESKPSKPANVDEYIARYPPEVQRALKRLRSVIRKAAPKAEERISYQIPGFYQDGYLVWFAAFADHISFFPKGSGVSAFKKDLAAYKVAKGTIQFPLGTPIPYELITKIVKYRLAENRKKASARR